MTVENFEEGLCKIMKNKKEWVEKILKSSTHIREYFQLYNSRSFKASFPEGKLSDKLS